MKILVLGAGKMGAWFIESLCLDHDVAVFDYNKSRLKYLFKTHRLLSHEDIKEFQPELLINAVSLQHTIEAFKEVIPFIPESCILSDITSVKNGLKKFYRSSKRRFVSTHPMFGPTFANIKELANENAIIIAESDKEGKEFFREFYASFHLNIYDYSFDQHDQTIAYSLSIPFSSTLVFASCMVTQEAPGTTFRKHLNIAKGLMSEDDYLLSEILLNPYTIKQVKNIHESLDHLIQLIEKHDVKGLHAFFGKLRKNIE
jgi:prephenate dehydrogenase